MKGSVNFTMHSAYPHNELTRAIVLALYGMRLP